MRRGWKPGIVSGGPYCRRLRAAASCQGYRHAGWRRALAPLRQLPAPQRRELRQALAERYPTLDGGPEIHCGALVLDELLTDREYPAVVDHLDALVAARRTHALDELARLWAFPCFSRFEVLAEAESAAGHPLAPSVVAVFRRTALTVGDAADADDLAALRGLVGRLADPVLDVGEAWAEQALADATTPDWQRPAHPAPAPAAALRTGPRPAPGPAQRHRAARSGPAAGPAAPRTRPRSTPSPHWPKPHSSRCPDGAPGAARWQPRPPPPGPGFSRDSFLLQDDLNSLNCHIRSSGLGE